MKTVKDKYLVVGADFAGFPLKEAVVKHLDKKGWKILDLGVKKDRKLYLRATRSRMTVENVRLEKDFGKAQEKALFE